MDALHRYGGVEGLATLLLSDAHKGLDPLATGPASVSAHREAFGANEFAEVPPKSFFVIAWENLHDPIIILLCVAALVRVGGGCVRVPVREQPSGRLAVARCHRDSHVWGVVV